jgi:phosphosulfolactate synthase (CoM biosynthesis protein A)
MRAAMKLQHVKEVVHVSSSFWKCCKYCSALKLSEDSVEEQVNHYLRHGLKLLHIGTESSRTDEGAIWHSTVAVLGKD